MLNGFGDAISGVQALVFWALFLLSMGIKAYAVIHAVRHKPEHFVAAGKRTKNVWLAITGVSLAVNIVIFNPLQILNIVGLVASAIYLADVRPALQQVTGRGGSSSSGPYGGW